jgi:hypothetical protein
VSAVLSIALLGGTAVAAPIPLIIDACVAVDPEEVRRLTAIELLTDESDHSEFEVLVGCRGDSQTLRLLHVSRGVVDSRSLEPGKADAPDARNRELALAIAELVRRTPDLAVAAPAVEMPAQPPQLRVSSTAVDSQPVLVPLSPVSDEPGEWLAEIGVLGAFVHWSRGHRLLGADLVVRVPLRSRMVSELRAGGRKTIGSVALSEGWLDARGFGAALGLGFDVAPTQGFVGLTVGVRVGVDWLRYAIVDEGGTPYSGADAADVHAMGTLATFVALSEHLRLTCELAAGGALHPIVIRENGQDVSGARGVMASGAFGLAARF